MDRWKLNLFGSDRKLGKQFNNGETVFSQGDAADCLYVVQQGKVEMILKTSAGEKKLGILEKGEIVGEASFFAGRTRYTSARAVGRTQLMRLDRPTFLNRFHLDPSLAFGILEKMSRRIYDLDHELVFRLQDHGLPKGDYSYADLRRLDDILPGEVERVRMTNQVLALAVLEIKNLPVPTNPFETASQDQLLKTLSEMVRRQLRTTDIISRLDHNRIGLLLFEADGTTASMVLRKIRATFAGTPLDCKEDEGGFTGDFRCGLSIFPEHEEPQQLIHKSLAALNETRPTDKDWILLAPPTVTRVERIPLTPEQAKDKSRGGKSAMAMAMDFLRRSSNSG